jgi:hypothetical protein
MRKDKETLRPGSTDLQDSRDDIEHLQQEETTIDLPEVKDIPGQEHVRPMPPGEMADTTIASAGEEGKEIIGLEDDEEADELSADTNVTPEEKELLSQSSVSMSTGDDQQLRKAALDNVDDDGEQLNEKIDQSGNDLDVPGTDEDGNTEEDEENSQFSLNDDKEDDITNRQ